MGAYCSRSKPLRIIIEGLDCAGKTSVLYALKLGEVVVTIPTIGFNVEEVNVNGFEINCWDLGGRDKIRPLFRHYYPGTNGIVFVIDSNDTERLDQALDEMEDHIFKEEATENTVIMVLANKQDLKGALSLDKIEEKIKDKIKDKISTYSPTLGGRVVFVKGCSVVNQEGIGEAFSKFVEMIRRQRAGEISPGFVASCHSDLDNDDKEDNNHIIDQKKNNQSKFFHLEKLFNISFLKSILFY